MSRIDGRVSLPPLRTMVGDYLGDAAHPLYPANGYDPESAESRFRRPGTSAAPSFHPYAPSVASPAAVRPSLSRRSSSDSPPEGSPTNGARSSRGGVPVACVPCRLAHLACSSGRPCRRCIETGRIGDCNDPPPRRRGRPPGPGALAVQAQTREVADAAYGIRSPATLLATSHPPSPDPSPAYVLLTPSLRCVRATEAAAALLGQPRQTLATMSLQTFIHPEDRHSFTRFISQVMLGRGSSYAGHPDIGLLQSLPWTRLLGPRSGAPQCTGSVRLRNLVRDSHVGVSLEGYLGAGLTEAYDPNDPRSTYIVVKLTPVERAMPIPGAAMAGTERASYDRARPTFAGSPASADSTSTMMSTPGVGPSGRYNGTQASPSTMYSPIYSRSDASGSGARDAWSTPYSSTPTYSGRFGR